MDAASVRLSGDNFTSDPAAESLDLISLDSFAASGPPLHFLLDFGSCEPFKLATGAGQLPGFRVPMEESFQESFPRSLVDFPRFSSWSALLHEGLLLVARLITLPDARRISRVSPQRISKETHCHLGPADGCQVGLQSLGKNKNADRVVNLPLRERRTRAAREVYDEIVKKHIIIVIHIHRPVSCSYHALMALSTLYIKI